MVENYFSPHFRLFRRIGKIKSSEFTISAAKKRKTGNRVGGGSHVLSPDWPFLKNIFNFLATNFKCFLSSFCHLTGLKVELNQNQQQNNAIRFTNGLQFNYVQMNVEE